VLCFLINGVYILGVWDVVGLTVLIPVLILVAMSLEMLMPFWLARALSC